MPVYSLTSPESGRTYQVNIDGQPDAADMDEIWPQLDAHAAQQEANKPFFSLGDTLSGIGTALGGLPETATASYYRLTEGMKRPDQYSPEARAAFDAEQKFTQQVQQESQNRLMRGEASSTGESFRDAAPSLGFSGVTMGANILGRVVGRPAGAVVGGLVSAPSGPGVVGGAGIGGAIGQTAAGMAASGYAAYRMAGNQFLDQAFQRIGEERAKRGEPWGEQEKAQAYNELLPLAQNTGLWEAGPEAVGNAVGLAAGKYVLGLGKKAATDLAETIWKKASKKVAALAGGTVSELGTETITQVGSAPAQAQAEALAQGNPNWQQEQGPYAGPGGTLKALADVAPATLAQSALMLGAGSAVKTGQMLIDQRRKGVGQPLSEASAVAPDANEDGYVQEEAFTQADAQAEEMAARGAMEVPGVPLTGPSEADVRSVLEAASNPNVSRRQPILSNVPDRMARVRENALNTEPIMEGDVITDLRVPRSPQAIAESQRLEKDRAAKEAEMRMLEAKARGMPMVADSPTGSRDIVDWANENPIYLPPGFSAERKNAEYDALQRNPLPPYWRQFVASSKQGGNPDSIAQRAFDAGLIAEPTPDAYMQALQEGIAGRQQYRVQFAQRDKALAQEEKRVIDFEKSQSKLAKKKEAQQVPFEDIVPGDEMTIDGEQAVVRNVEYNEDGYLTNVVIEDGKRFGLMQFDPQTRGGLLVDEFKPASQPFAPAATKDQPQTITGSNVQRGTEMPVPPPTAAAGAGAGGVTRPGTTATPRATATARAPAASVSGGQGVASGGGAGASQTVAPATGEVNLEDVNAEMQLAGGFTNLDVSGRTAGFLNTEILAEAEALVRRGVRSFAQWSQAMVRRFGDAIRAYLAGVWDNVRRNSELGAVMNPLARGPLRAPESGMASASGAAQANEPSPGGLSQAERRRMAVLQQRLAETASQEFTLKSKAVFRGKMRVFVGKSASEAKNWIKAQRPQDTAEQASMREELKALNAKAYAYSLSRSKPLREKAEISPSVENSLTDDLTDDQRRTQDRAAAYDLLLQMEGQSIPLISEKYQAATLSRFDASAKSDSLYLRFYLTPTPEYFKQIQQWSEDQLWESGMPRDLGDVEAGYTPGDATIAFTVRISDHPTPASSRTVTDYDVAVDDGAAWSQGNNWYKGNGEARTFAGAVANLFSLPGIQKQLGLKQQTPTVASEGFVPVGTPALRQGADQNLPDNQLFSGNVNPESSRAAGGTQGFKNLDTSGRTAGFLNTEILAEARQLIADGFTTFANWSQAMVRRFGEAIRAYLAGVWDNVRRNSELGAVMNPLARGPLRAPESGMASASGAAQANEPSPGGLNEAEAEAFHGSNVKSPQFDLQFLLSGEGRLGFGPGFSFTEWRPLAESYQGINGEVVRKIMPPKNELIDWNAPLEAQSKLVNDLALKYRELNPTSTGEELFDAMLRRVKGNPEQKQIALLPILQDSGLKGVVYDNVESLNAPDSVRNYTIWDTDYLNQSFNRSRAAGGTQGFKNLDTSGRTAGFLNAEILSEARQLIADGFTTFANWSKAMVTRFGRGIREFLQGIWQQITSPQTNAAQNVRLGMPQGNAPVSIGAGGFVGGGQASNIPEGQDVTRSRFASPDEGANLYDIQATETMRAESAAWLEANGIDAALASMEANSPPEGLRIDHLPSLGAQVITRLAKLAESGTEAQRLQADALLDRAGRAWHGKASQEAGRTLQQRAMATDELRGIAPILATKQVLVERADRVVKERFEGGAEGAVQQVKDIDTKASTQAGEELAAQLEGEPDAPELGDNPEVVPVNDSRVAELEKQMQDLRKQMVREQTQAESTLAQTTSTWQKIMGVLQAAGGRKSSLLTGAKGKLAAMRKAALARKAARRAEGRLSVNPVEDFADDAIIGAAILAEGLVEFTNWSQAIMREVGFRSGQDLRRLYEQASKKYLEALEAEKAAPTKAKGTPKQRQAREKINKAQRTAQNILDSLARRYSDPPIFAEGQRRVNAMRELYKERVKTGMPEAEFVKRAMALGANEGTAGILWEASKLEIDAREMMALEKSREGLAAYLKKDSPALAKLLDALRKKVAPGMTWAEIFMTLPAEQKARQREIYRRLMLDERLKALNQGERLQLTNELDRAWQRERRKVFVRELEKITGLGKTKKDNDKVKAALPRLLRLMNLGMLNSETFRGAIAQEYGIQQIDAATGAELRKLGEQIQQAPEGLPRRKLEQQLMQRLQNLTGSTMAEILESWWTASVLSGWRTQMDIALSLANGLEDVTLGSLVTALRTGNGRVAKDALFAMLSNLPTAMNEALDHLLTGNRAAMRSYDAEVKAALEDGNKLFGNVGRQLLNKGGMARLPGAFMEFVSRLMTALDHINSTSTYEGAKAMALARHPELYEKALTISPQDRQAARTQARLELTGGEAPTTRQQRVEEEARMKEILDERVPLEVQAQAREIGLESALQGEPTGLGHFVYKAANNINQTMRQAEAAYDKSRPDNAAGKAVMAALRLSSTLVKVLTGTKFVRTVGHSVNRSLSYAPGIGLVRFAEGGMKGAKADILLAKQLMGTAVGLALLMAFRDGEDDEQGIEGSHRDLTPQQRGQLLAQGRPPYSVWKRDAQGRIRSWNYQQWGIAGVLATIGAMEDQRRYNSAGKDDLAILMDGIVSGSMAWMDKTQLTGIQMLMGGDQPGSSSPSSNLAGALNKWASTTVGGLVPRILKDVDMVISPQLRDTSEWWMKWAGQVPMVRELSSGKRVNIFGEDIVLDRTPTSRITQVGTLDPALRTLGRLNERDIWLPDPTQGVRMVKLADGTRRKMTAAEKDRYQRATGAAYRKFITEQGAALLRMDAELARETISKVTERLRNQAAYQAVRR